MLCIKGHYALRLRDEHLSSKDGKTIYFTNNQFNLSWRDYTHLINEPTAVESVYHLPGADSKTDMISSGWQDPKPLDDTELISPSLLKLNI